MPVRVYGETEVFTAIVKILCFLGIIIVSLVITLGGAPNHKRTGFHYWNDPGPWTNYNGAFRWLSLFPLTLPHAFQSASY